MKSHGILMSGEMVRAWLAGLKSQTRRTRGLDVVNEHPDDWRLENINPKFFHAVFQQISELTRVIIRPPYGVVGDELWFKETWKMWEREGDGRDFIHYRADDAKVDPTWWTEKDWKEINSSYFGKWHSSMMMPRRFGRIAVTVTGVRVERLRDITEKDALAEGMGIFAIGDWMGGPIGTYFMLWDKLNGKKMPASQNPWVWVYEFQERKLTS